MKKIFCITGMTGSGKSTILDNLNNLFRENKLDNKIKPLIYCTTRDKRDYEEDNKDYYFKTYDEFKNATDILESREYNMITGPVYYYTTRQCLESADNFIVAAAIEQLANYIKNKEIDTYCIMLKCPLQVRFRRVMDNRCTTDKDLLELCRRVIQEKEDYSNPEVLDIISSLDTSKTMTVDTEPDSNIVRDTTLALIYDWIRKEI